MFTLVSCYLRKYLKGKYYWLDIRKIKVQIVLKIWAALYWTCEWYMRNTCMEVPPLPFLLHHSISVRFCSMKYILQKKYLLCMSISWSSRAKIPGLESWCYHLFVWPWASYFTSPYLSFLMYNIYLTRSFWALKTKWVINMHVKLSLIPSTW